MADRPDASDPTPPVSRRSFLRASALGAGAVALPLTAHATTPAPSPAPPAPPAPRRPWAAAPTGTWVEPLVWDVRDHGSVPLQLAVQEVAAPPWLHENGGTPEAPLGPETIFTYNGSIPGPTVRMGGDDVLPVQLVNALSGNNEAWAHANGSRFAEDVEVPGTDGTYSPGVRNTVVPDVPDWQLSGLLMYGPHMQHTTNLHTHGLHVRPGLNPDGTHSDNVMLRVIPVEDYRNRMANDPPIPLLTHNPSDMQHVELVGAASYEFRLGATSDTPTHPPGTHWYHPHPHGATYDQVASGMAGFLIVEGDVDVALADLFGADPRTPSTPSGPYGYRERLMLFQRVFDTGVAPLVEGEGGEGSNVKNKQSAIQTVNGQPAGSLGFTMEAGAAERWRVLNGSVDGEGYVAFCVAPAGATPPAQGSQTPEQYNDEVEAWARANAVSLYNVAFDGVTLVSPAGDYTAIEVPALQLAPANRADFLFQAPTTAGAYTVWVIGVTHKAGDLPKPPTEIAALTVTERASPPPPVSLAEVRAALGAVPVPEHLLPVTDAELRDRAGDVRSRQLVYAGWGGAGYPNPCNDLGPTATAGAPLPPGPANSMTISRVKYDPDKPVQLMGLDTAEEWVLDNYSVKSTTTCPSSGAPTPGGDLPLPCSIATGGAVDHPFHMHQNPFYVLAILQPQYPVLRDGYVDLDAEPTYVNRLPAPRWQDVVAIPNDGGRVVFRSRFPDYHGFFVNHCHLLQHEDWGMMQAVEVIDPADPAEYRTPNPNLHAAPYDLSDPNGGTPVYPKPTVREMLDYCQTFYDLDGTVAQGGVIEGATPQNFCG